MAPLYRKMEARQPSNFTARFYQIRPTEYLTKIVREGGESNNLSKYMPPFKEELSKRQIDDVVYFIKYVSQYYYDRNKNK